jgi:protein phosphatase
MFACPHCQSENPIHNRFCQRCGQPLRALLAIIAPAPSATPTAAEPSTRATSVAAPAEPEPDKVNASPSLADLLTEEHYLDPEKRYQLRQTPVAATPIVPELEVGIVDCQPAMLSPFLQQLEALGDMEEDEWEALLPALAYPYWKLQDQFFPAVPELQAAWQAQANWTVLITEDRSTWQLLSEALQAETIEPLEKVHWFYEMINLWEGLVAYDAEPSLLSQQNLRVDDDQIFCIRRLHYRSGDRSYELKDLGLLWQSLLQQMTTGPIPSLENLALAIALGDVLEIPAIREKLATIADDLQTQQAVTVNQNDPDWASPPTDPIPSPTLESADSPATEKPLLEMDDLLIADGWNDADETAAVELDAPEESITDLPTMALPMRLYRVDEVGRTHVGRQRAHNEDSFFAETEIRRTDSPVGPTLQARGLYILCDGMGGHSGGEVASALAVETIRDYFATHWTGELPPEAVIRAGILQANQVIFEKNEAEGRTGNSRMGTTLVMVLLADSEAVVAHVGDSRLYCLTRYGLEQATVDHEVGQREINRGVEPAIAYARPDAYQLTQALGPRSNDEVSPNITTLPIAQDTLFLLCSDGLSDNDLLESHVESHLEPLLRSRTDLEEGVANLIDLANQHNGHDNITAIVVRVKVRPNLEAIQKPT